MFKRFIIFLTIISMTICSLSISAFANTTSLAEFDFNIYKAQINTDENLPPYKALELKSVAPSPAWVIINSLESNSAFIKNVEQWKQATFSPSAPVKDQLTQEEYYEAIILSAFKAECERTVFDEIMDNRYSVMFDDLTSSINAGFGEEVLNRFSELSSEEQLKLEGSVDKWLEKTNPGLKNSMSGLSIIHDVFTLYDNISDASKNLVAYVTCASMGEDVKNVIKYLYDSYDGSNIYLKTALFKISSACTNPYLAMDVAMFDAAAKGFTNIVNSVMDTGWETTIGLVFGGKLLLAQAVGRAVVDVCFSTDQIIEQYYKLKATLEFRDLLFPAVNHFKDRFINNQITDNANDYFAIVSAMYSEYDIECDYANDFADIVYSGNLVSLIPEIFGGSRTKYEEFKTSVNNMKSLNQDELMHFETFYLYTLEDDYPEIYAQLNQVETPEYIPVNSIAFEKENVEWGMKDFLYSSYEATITPENATNKAIIYTSSDESVLTYNSYGSPKLNGIGTVTITATAVDSGKTATLNVTIVEDHGADGLNMEDWDSNRDQEYTYEELSDGTIRITKYKGSSSWLNIPTSFNGKNVTEIGDSAFAGNKSITRVVIPQYVTNIGNNAFSGCSSLTELTLPEGVKKLGALMIAGTSISEIFIPKSVVESGCAYSYGTYHGGALGDCATLKEVTFEEGMINIPMDICLDGDQNRSGLEKINLPSTIECIGAGAFMNNVNLKSVDIPAQVTEIGNGAFSGCSSMERVSMATSNLEKAIGDSAFVDCISLKLVELPVGLKEIGCSAFSGCSSLTELNLPEGVEKLGYYLISGTSISEIFIPKSVKESQSYGSYDDSEGALSGCEKLKTVTFEDGMMQIPDYICSDGNQKRSGIETINLPSTIERIGNYAFWGNVNLKSVDIPAQVTEIGNGAFSGCSSMERVSVATSNLEKAIGDSAFAGCISLKLVELPVGLKEIGGCAFSGCSSLTELTLPEGVKKLGALMIAGTSISEIFIPKSVVESGCAYSYGTYHGGALGDCATLKEVTFEEGMINIPIDICLDGDQNRSGLEKINLPSTIECIGAGAFMNNVNLKSVDIPAQVTEIGNDVFMNCPLLTIYGYKDSYAQTYASENDIPFVAIDSVDSVTDVFVDVFEYDWFKDAVQYVYDYGMMSGDGNTFSPYDNMTRAMMVSTLYRLDGSPEVTDFTATSVFGDVYSGAWFETAVNWSYNEGISVGYPDIMQFGVSDSVTREQLAALLYRYAEKNGYDVSAREDLIEYIGYNEISEYAKDSMSWAVSVGIISGIKSEENGVVTYDLAPKGYATRAQLASILMRFCDYYGI